MRKLGNLSAAILIMTEYTFLHSHNEAVRALGTVIGVLVIWALLEMKDEGKR